MFLVTFPQCLEGDAIAQVPFFKHLPHTFVSSLALLMQPIILPPQHVVYREGEISADMYASILACFVFSGSRVVSAPIMLLFPFTRYIAWFSCQVPRTSRTCGWYAGLWRETSTSVHSSSRRVFRRAGIIMRWLSRTHHGDYIFLRAFPSDP